MNNEMGRWDAGVAGILLARELQAARSVMRMAGTEYRDGEWARGERSERQAVSERADEVARGGRLAG